ncbi:MAG: branched-chain amino acid ABC transporter permease [Candidatus Peregrinibacteria bacterium]|nr:branched-chain amino acid ABC transporter permease [Candidatus Peregrinibacteria bacterium]
MDFFLHLVVTIGLWIPISMGYTLLFGKGQVMHFGPIGVSVACGYAIFVTLGATGSYIAGIAMGILVGTAVSLIFAWLALRLENDGLGVMSIAVHLAAMVIVLNWTDVTRGALGIPRIPRMPFLETLPMFALAVTLASLFWIALFVWADRSALGRQMQALSESESFAKAMGVSRAKVHTIAFVLLGLAIVSDNVFFAQYIHLLHPNDYHFPTFIFLLAIVVAGKPGSMVGAVLSSILLVLLREGLRFIDLPISVLGPMRLLLFGVILLTAVYVRRDTLFPQKRTV